MNTAHRGRGRSRPWRQLRAGFSVLLSFSLVAGNAGVASAVRPAVVSRIGLIQSDMEYILQQIKIAEAHPDGATLCTDPGFPANPLLCATEVTSTTLPYGLRTVDGRYNNLVAGQSAFGASDRVFPRQAPPTFGPAEDVPSGFGPPGSTSYTQNTGFVFDSRPRLISNLISDQTANNSAATDAYNHPTGHGFGNSIITVDSYRNGVPTPVQEYELPNVAPDAGLSPSFNSLFTFFGQFFDHGLDHVNKGGSGTVFVPLKPDDPLYVAGAPTNFMVLSRATNQPGPDGILGTTDDIKDGVNSDTPYVDQSQTYTSHPSHQVFLREYALSNAGLPVSTGRLINGAAGGLPTWADVKAQAANLLGIQLSDQDVLNVPLLRTDAYGRFIPGAHGYPQIATPSGFVEGDPAASGGLGVSPTAVGAFRTNHAFLDDISQNAIPGPGLTPDPDTSISVPGSSQPAGTYDDELLNAHYITGDGRGNENIGLTAIHHIFHSEHNGEVSDIKTLVTSFPVGSPADLSQWQLSPGVWNGERLFQAAKFVTEMEYQHIVFEEFARFVQPAVNAFSTYDSSIDPAITAEFAHAVYRFGHSMLNETLPRINVDGKPNDIGLIQAFTNPVAFLDGGAAGTLTADQAAGALVQGMAAQRGNEIDEFVTEALRNNLLGIPLDLATLNLTRARSEGIPTLNRARRIFYAGSIGSGLNSSVRPYSSWIDFGLALRHSASLVNFIAAYGTHPTIRDSGLDGVLGTADDATTVAAKRAAAALIVSGATGAPTDSAAFMASTGAWANVNGVTNTGLDDVDLWIGGLAEKPPVFGGLLGSTFNFVFETQMQRLQDNDRFYYLSRLAGTHLLEQIEGSSFAKLAMRNTTAKDLPALAFTKPDWAFDISAQTNPNGIVDDPNTTYDETNLDGTSKLIRMADGTIRLTGGGTTENHSIFAGTNDDDRLQGAEGDDSLWGNDGNDRLEGGAGNDHLEGGAGKDILTDSFGIDILNGGDGNDVVAGGRGPDVLLGGNGSDYIVHGDDPSESFGGLGNDFIAGGAGADSIQGNEGDDWIEGGGGADVLRGDNAAPFPISAGGNDVLLGDAGNDNYGGEGGMDIMAAGSGPALIDGGLGFDWVTYVRKPAPANADLLNTVLAPPNPLNLNDRYLFDEAVSGGPFNDAIRGDAGNGPGHELTHDNLAAINGLSTLLSSTGTLLPGTGATPAFDVGGNILLGGPGSDILEGRGGNDLIDGDAWLNVRLTATDSAGNTIQASKMSDLQVAALNGTIDPGTIRVVREILTTPGDTSCDSAVFTDSRANYTITPNANGTFTISHLAGLGIDGIDTVRNIERLQFADKFVSIGAAGTCLPNATGTVTISNLTPTENQLLTATPAITDPDGLDPTTVLLSWQYRAASGSWITVGTGSSFTANNTEVGFPLRVVASYTDKIGIAETVTGASTAPVINVNDPPTGAPVLSTTTPVVGAAVTTSTSTITDADGLVGVTFHFQWQAGTTDIAGATNPTFTPTSAQVGSTLRVVVSYVDNHGSAETVASAPSSAVTNGSAAVAAVSPTSLTFAPQNTGTTSAAQTVTLTNAGTLNLVVSGVSVSGSNQLDFVVSSACATVVPGGSCTIGVSFKPSTGGAETATLAINHNAGVPSNVSLSGTGVVPAVLSVATSLDFSAQRINTDTTKQLMVKNTGTAPLVFSSLKTSGAPFLNANLGSCPITLGPGKGCKISVTFHPTAIQAYTGTLTILSNATNSPTIVALTGSGKR